ASWLLWARSDQFVHPLRRKLIALGLTHQSCADLLGSAVEAEDWRPLATLEAATRTIEAMVCSGGLRRSKEATHMLEQLLQRASKDIGEGTNAIPTHYWSVRSAPPGPNGQEQVLLQGAVLVHVRGRVSAAPPDAQCGTSQIPSSAPLSPELMAALEE